MRDHLQFINVRANNIAQFAQGISDIYFVRHQQRYDQAYWQWRYLDGPGGPSDLVVALRKDKVVGLYGVLYVPMLLQGRQTLAGLMGSLAIDPAEKSWQCYRGLVDRSMSNGQQKALVFRFGLAHLRVTTLIQHMRVKCLGRMPILYGTLDVSQVLKAHNWPRLLSLAGHIIQPLIGLRTDAQQVSGLVVKEVVFFDHHFNSLWGELANCTYNGYVKNAAYLNWRYQQCPLQKYYKLAAYRNNKLEGFIVFCLTGIRSGACVLELVVNNYDVQIMRSLLSAALEQLAAYKVGSVIACFVNNAAALNVARASGFKLSTRFLKDHQMVVAANRVEDMYSEQDLRMCEFSFGDWLEL